MTTHDQHKMAPLCTRNAATEPSAQWTCTCPPGADAQSGTLEATCEKTGFKPKRETIATTAALIVALLSLTGCVSTESYQYNRATPAARIHESNARTQDETTRPQPIEVPVEPGTPEAARYLRFSPVYVQVSQGDSGGKSVKVKTSVRPVPMRWRVALLKDQKEIHVFEALGVSELLGHSIPLKPLAVDESLPVPDKIIVTPLEPNQ